MTVFAESTCERKLVLGKRTVKPEGNLFLYRLDLAVCLVLVSQSFRIKP